MVTTTQILQAIAAVSKRVEEINGRLDSVFTILHNNNVANIDYLAMMTDNDLPSEEEKIMSRMKEDQENGTQ